MISHQLKVIFIHIPKVAGQSIEQCFITHHGISWEHRDVLLLKENSNPAKGPPRLAHLTASEYKDYGYISSDNFENYFKFSFVRNPWARLVSEYKWRGYYTKWRFKDWLKYGFPKPARTSYWRHVMPQYDYLFDSAGNCLVDFIGHFENLTEDFNHFRQKASLQLPDLPHVNKSSNKIGGIQDLASLQTARFLWKKLKAKQPVYPSYLEYYDDWSWSWVAERYQKDIEAFGYIDQVMTFK